MTDLPERIYVTPDYDDHLNPVGEDWSHGEWLANHGPGDYAEYLSRAHVAALLAEERRKALEEAELACAPHDDDGMDRQCKAECQRAIRALTDAPALRCAECDCETGGEDCNWIAVGPAPAREVTVREAMLKWCDDRQAEVMGCLELNGKEEVAAILWLNNFRAALRALSQGGEDNG